MGKIENDELRKIRNEHFIRAFEFIAKKKGIGQGKLAELIGSKSAYISNFRKGLRPIPEETIEELIRVSAFVPGCQIYEGFLRGNSEIMLLKNVSDEELVQSQLRDSNPDYDVMERHRKESEKKDELTPASSVDASSAINAAIAAYAELTNRLKKEMSDRLADKDTIIAEKQSRIESLERTISDLERTIADKDAIIRARDARILALERQIANINASDLSRYPFAIGAAEEQNNSNVSPYQTETPRKHP
jgi:transcriptional regulator with XRE-family HTH domain